jgi:hypothetical protein
VPDLWKPIDQTVNRANYPVYLMIWSDKLAAKKIHPIGIPGGVEKVI